uniref:Uncharacterized protein n=1 Tax=Anguilla anguilla TaxID=7936 RepID=A0A0E9SYD7_ANGAN
MLTQTTGKRYQFMGLVCETLYTSHIMYYLGMLSIL